MSDALIQKPSWSRSICRDVDGEVYNQVCGQSWKRTQVQVRVLIWAGLRSPTWDPARQQILMVGRAQAEPHIKRRLEAVYA